MFHYGQGSLLVDSCINGLEVDGTLVGYQSGTLESSNHSGHGCILRACQGSFKINSHDNGGNGIIVQKASNIFDAGSTFANNTLADTNIDGTSQFVT